MRFETAEIHLIYIRRKYTLYIRNTFRKPKATELASIENVWHEKKSTATMYLCQSHFSFFTGACKHLHHASEAADYFLPLSTHKWNKMKKTAAQNPEIHADFLVG
jgi:hypothetical protein